MCAVCSTHGSSCLSSLGHVGGVGRPQVINALTSGRGGSGEGATGLGPGPGWSGPPRHVPYRDSKLTRMLQVVCVFWEYVLGNPCGLRERKPPVGARRFQTPVSYLCTCIGAHGLVVGECDLIVSQDSLGGNSRTVMIACVSPADANLDVRVTICIRSCHSSWVVVG